MTVAFLQACAYAGGVFRSARDARRRIFLAVASLFAAISAIVPAAPSRAADEVKLYEFTPWLVENAGPEKAKGVIYYARGWGQFECCRNRDDFQMVPYFLRSLSLTGWDVLAAKIPEGPRSERASEAVPGGVAFLKRRVRELKAQGYKRVVLGGHSWGAWLSLAAAQEADLGADMLLLNSPSTYGPDVIPGGPRRGMPNPLHIRNWTEFGPLIDGVKVPLVLMLFADDPFEPAAADRGAYARETLKARGIAYMVIDKPAGFTGHSGPWLPVFDFAFGGCIRAFMERPRSAVCRPGRLRDDDFRSVVALRQLGPDRSKRSIASASDLAGKKFAVYTLDDSMRHYEYVSESNRINMYSLDSRSETYALRQGLHCVGVQCSRLIPWSGNKALEFDVKTGKLRAWWIAR